MSDFIQEHISDTGLVTLVMNQPDKKNAMNAVMRDTLADKISSYNTNAKVKGLIITGAEGNYSAGGDIQGLMKVDKKDFRHYLKAGHRLITELWNFEKPAVAAIEGVGVGGGLALAMCCDHVVMGTSAKIGFTFVKIGFVPDWGTLYTLSQRVGPAKARQLFLSANLLNANDAHTIGLVDEIAEDSEVQSTAERVAHSLMRRPSKAYAYTKRFMQNMPDSLEQCLEFEVMVQENCFKSEEFLQGVEKFIDKA